MKVRKEKETAAFLLILKPENVEDNTLLLEMINKGYYSTYSQINSKVQELTVYPKKIDIKTK